MHSKPTFKSQDIRWSNLADIYANFLLKVYPESWYFSLPTHNLAFSLFGLNIICALSWEPFLRHSRSLIFFLLSIFQPLVIFVFQNKTEKVWKVCVDFDSMCNRLRIVVGAARSTLAHRSLRLRLVETGRAPQNHPPLLLLTPLNH